jgi:hypothetical protein
MSPRPLRAAPALLLAACVSWFGLTELDALPADFPAPAGPELGHVTSTASAGRVAVAVDFPYDDEAVARAHYDEILAQVRAEGWAETGALEDPDGLRLERGEEALRVQCCARRADRRYLVMVSWTRPE